MGVGCEREGEQGEGRQRDTKRNIYYYNNDGIDDNDNDDSIILILTMLMIIGDYILKMMIMINMRFQNEDVHHR